MIWIWLLLSNPVSPPPTDDVLWRALIESRASRQTQSLSRDQWAVNQRSDLKLQEFLLTVAQNGDPVGRDRVAAFLDHPRLQATALLAYGEMTGAPTNVLWDLDVQPKNRVLWIEALAKLIGEGERGRLTDAWQGLDAKARNQALFHLYAHPTELLTRAVKEKVNSGERSLAGYVYYLYRARIRMEATDLANLLNRLGDQKQSVIYALRIRTETPDDALRQVYARLCRAEDWRLRVNALNALAATEPDAKMMEKLGFELLADVNPNVRRTAIGHLVRLERDAVDKKLAYWPNTLSDGLVAHLLDSAPVDRLDPFMRLIRGWEKPENPWRRARWLRIQSRLSGEKSDGVLRNMLKGWRWEQGSSGEKVLALNALAARKSDALRDALTAAFSSGDDYLLGAATNVIREHEAYRDLITFDKLRELAQKRYVGTGFHDAYLRAITVLTDETRAETLKAELLQHPDYRVRLKALSALSSPSDEQRSAVFAKPWRRQLAPEIISDATAFIAGGKDKIWVIQTNKGDIRIRLHGAYAPITAASIMHLSGQDYWDQMAWHRVIPNFVAQGGDRRGDGSGGPGYTIPGEINALRYRRGSVGMALSGKDTGGGQFFICHSDQPHLDGGYTVFGSVIGGMGVVDRLEEGDLIIDTRIEEGS